MILKVFRSGEGFGIRLDGASAFAGAVVSPHYDSLLVKVIAHAKDLSSTSSKMNRALREFRIRGVKTNIPFLLNVLENPKFLGGTIDTNFIDEHPDLFQFEATQNRAQKLLRDQKPKVNSALCGGGDVNGPTLPSPRVEAIKPGATCPPGTPAKRGAQKPFLPKLPRNQKGPFCLRTRLSATPSFAVGGHACNPRSAEDTALRVHAFQNFSRWRIWGGATFDVAMRFSHPDARGSDFSAMRALKIPNVPFRCAERGQRSGLHIHPDNVV
ncbi:hypothetical protein JTE90_008870 [Oedothorax gibbosus]|uniref:Biotin carboxylation domain-containing protein n=1 Tax=Oedothorax gibbosus TaxID=931172 RepID=A0AAV6TM95_9ARAC|nr:hypothetical protein JTE90_008870 [Oedothorax gibbosus]